MEFADFEGAHKGEEVICIGNGPSLDNIPLSFLRSRPSFGLNYLPTYNDLLDGFLPTYWLALDRAAMEVIPSLPQKLPKFVPHRQCQTLEAEGITKANANVIPFKMRDMDRPSGMAYGTSLMAAAHIASIHMQASTVLLVGFDCAKAKQTHRSLVIGKNGTPRFYDSEHESKVMKGWCDMFGTFDKFLNKRGQGIINLSNPTFCKSLKQRSVFRYAEAS